MHLYICNKVSQDDWQFPDITLHNPPLHENIDLVQKEKGIPQEIH
jgi:hypothetical protein